MEQIIDLIFEPWPWYISGPLMGATIPLLLFWGNKMLGASSSLQHIIALIPNKIEYFQCDIEKDVWNFHFVFGVILGAMVCYHLFYEVDAVAISAATKLDLYALGLQNLNGLMPEEIFDADQLWTIQGLLFTVFGGFLVGFGVRYAGGCTSGHGFMGLSQFSLSSAIAIISFFIGGIIATYFILPLLISPISGA